MRYENTGATESSEDYLEAILVIRAERGFCRNADIAERLGVARPSVTKALAGLSSRSLVEVAGRDVRLTPEGRRLAGATLDWAVAATWLNGRRVFDGTKVDTAVRGRALRFNR